MSANFTQQARHALFFAQEAAAQLGAERVDAEHLLLGLVHHEETVVATILHEIGISGTRIRSAVERLTARGSSDGVAQRELTYLAQRVLNLAEEEAAERGSSLVGGEHLLLALLRIDEGISGRVLGNLGITWERVNTEAARLAALPADETHPIQTLLHQMGKQLLELYPNLTDMPAEQLKELLFAPQKEA